MPRKSSKNSPVAGHAIRADKVGVALPATGETRSSGEGRSGVVNKTLGEVPSLDDTIAQIRYWHRQRCFAMESRKRADLALGAFLRTALGWRRDLPKDESDAIKKRAAELADDATGTEWESIVAAAALAREPFAEVEKRSLDQMKVLAEQLPVWREFGEPIRGFGLASLAAIVAEAGDLSGYANHSKLWKRMGLAVMGDVRQGGLTKGASKEDWIAHGYNPARRSRMWNIGDTLIKGNRDGKYRTAYLARKAYELAREPDMQPIKAHRRAQRYMEKRLLRDLWQAWRRAGHNVQTSSQVPDAPISKAA